MKITEIVQPGRPCRLLHPTIGHVKWDGQYPGASEILMFAVGPERNEPLVVDEGVLFDDGWELYVEPWAGKLGRVADQCLVCGTRSIHFQASSHPTRCLSCFDKKANKHLVKRHEEMVEEAVKKWCADNGVDYEWEKTIFG